MSRKGNTTSVLIITILLLLLLIPSSAMVIANTILVKATIAYGQANQMNSNLTNPITTQNILPKKVHVGDIDIAYKMFGKGEVLVLIPGSSMTMDEWEPNVLNRLASNHTVIIFDNRGIGNTTAGNKTWSIEQFANDTAGLLDALKIEKPVDVLGFSLGGSVAQELTLMHPQQVNKLILYATSCGGKASVPPQISPTAMKSMMSGNASKDTFLSALFPKEWMKANAAYIQKFGSLMTLPPKESIQHQAVVSLNWKGTCDILPGITKPTLIITGTDDVTSPPANSLIIAQKIPGAWLVQIQGGGHGAMYQYPDNFSRIVLTFLET
jgi:pimeloyl-ACP methyl ester carboxylesterase